MKKAFFIFSVMFSISAMAQDTTTLGSPCYMQFPLPNTATLNTRCSFIPNCKHCIPFRASQKVSIYGVAVSGEIWDSNPLYFYLIDSLWAILDSVRVSSRDVKCYIDLSPMHDYRGSVKGCREVYFEEPISVSGKFYVAAKLFGWPSDIPWYYAGNISGNNYTPFEDPVLIFLPGNWLDPSDSVDKPDGLIDTIDCICPLFFPIVQPDRIMPCPPVTGLRVTQQGNYNVALAWDSAGDSVVYQLLFDGDTIQTTATTFSRYALAVDSSQHYKATVRYVCPHRANCQYHPDPIYSDWSDTLDIFLYGPGPGTTPTDSTDTVSIYAPVAIEGCVSVLPDPAHNHAEVLSSFGVSRVEVYSAAGLKVMDLKAEGFKATLDVSKLPSGTYLLRIHTQQGVVTKKLVKK